MNVCRVRSKPPGNLWSSEVPRRHACGSAVQSYLAENDRFVSVGWNFYCSAGNGLRHLYIATGRSKVRQLRHSSVGSSLQSPPLPVSLQDLL